MKNAFLRISQIQNAPNIPYYRDSRILKVVISPSEQYQYAPLSGLETLYTNKSFNFHYNENSSILKLILTETKPNNFDIAYTIIPLEKIQENSLVQETRIMQTIVSGIMSPLITFELQITSENTKSLNKPTKNLYPTLKSLDSADSLQKPFIPNDLDFTAINKKNQNFQKPFNDNFFVQNNEHSSCSSDYDGEEEDMIVNARIYFNDEAIKLLKSSQAYNKCEAPNLHQQKAKNSANKYQPAPQKNENNSIPFVPPDENDAPFLLPKPSLGEISKNQYQSIGNSSKNHITESAQQQQNMNQYQNPQNKYLQQHLQHQQNQELSNPQYEYQQNNSIQYNINSNDNNHYMNQPQITQNQSSKYSQANYQYYSQNQPFQKP